MMQLLWKQYGVSSKILKIDLQYDAATTFEYLSKIIKIRVSKIYMHSHIHWNIIHNRQNVEAT